MGYKTVQISAIGRELSPRRVREICDDNGLQIVLTHSDGNRILYDTQRLIEEHDILGCDYIGLGAMPDKYRTGEWISHFVDDFMEPARKIAAAGKLFMYHNHNFEFQKVSVSGREKTDTPHRIPDGEFFRKGNGIHAGHLLGGCCRRRCVLVDRAAEGSHSLRASEGHAGGRL